MNIKLFLSDVILGVAVVLASTCLIVWTASDGLHFRASVCSVALCSSVRLLYFALLWLLISLSFIHFIGV